jgi:ribosomal protein L24
MPMDLTFRQNRRRHRTRRVAVAAIFCWGVVSESSVACNRTEGPAQGDAGVRPIARGDRVVVEQAAAQFYEGQVLEVMEDRLRVQTIEGQQSKTVALPDVYRLPPPPGALQPSELAICSPAERRWLPCRVQRTDAAIVIVADAEGKSHRLQRERVIVPTAVTALNLRRHFERAQRRAQFVAAVKSAGRPKIPRGWRPAPRERVLGYRGVGWYSATIHELDDDALYVKWTADGRVTELRSENVIPEPPHEPGPQRGHYALARPLTPAKPWQPVRVHSVKGDVVVVSDADGARQSLPSRDLVPLP